jgi:metal-dependent HD superfamily phosphatase/phosphodiesterase
MISLLIMKIKSIHPMEWKVSFYRMNAFYISLLTMKSSIAFGTVKNKMSESSSAVVTIFLTRYIFEFLNNYHSEKKPFYSVCMWYRLVIYIRNQVLYYFV